MTVGLSVQRELREEGTVAVGAPAGGQKAKGPQ